jgi:hypothetical protein
LTIGLLIFLLFAVIVSYSSYKRKKEIEAKIEEWKKADRHAVSRKPWPKLQKGSLSSVPDFFHGPTLI